MSPVQKRRLPEMLPRLSALGRRGNHSFGKAAAQMIELIALSIVPPKAFVAQGQLHNLDLNQMMDDVHDLIAGSSLMTWAVLGLDISFNDMTKKGCGTGWQGQVYAIGETTNRRKLRDLINKALPKTTAVPRPIRTKRFDGSPRGASYALKFQFVQRNSYWNHKRKRPCWNTRKVRLNPPEHKELMLALDQFGLAGRMTVIGLSLSKNEMGEVTM